MSVIYYCLGVSYTVRIIVGFVIAPVVSAKLDLTVYRNPLQNLLVIGAYSYRYIKSNEEHT